MTQFFFKNKVQNIQQIEINALHFLLFNMNLDWLHYIFPNPKTKPI